MTMAGTQSRERATIDRYAREVESGLVFRNASRGAGSAIGYRPPARTDSYPAALGVLAKGAAIGPRQAQLIERVIRALPYSNGLCAHEVVAKMWDSAAAALDEKYFDYVLKASPEPGRASDYEKDFTLADRIGLLATLKIAAKCYGADFGGLGWCLAALIREHRVEVISEARATVYCE